MSKFLISILLISSMSYAAEQKTTRKVAQVDKCSGYVVVELKLHDNGIKSSTPGGAFVHDSVYIGVGADDKEASTNAQNACQAGKYSATDCQAATSTTYSGKDSKYSEAVKSITGCRN